MSGWNRSRGNLACFQPLGHKISLSLRHPCGPLLNSAAYSLSHGGTSLGNLIGDGVANQVMGRRSRPCQVVYSSRAASEGKADWLGRYRRPDSDVEALQLLLRNLAAIRPLLHRTCKVF